MVLGGIHNRMCVCVYCSMLLEGDVLRKVDTLIGILETIGFFLLVLGMALFFLSCICQLGDSICHAKCVRRNLITFIIFETGAGMWLTRTILLIILLWLRRKDEKMLHLRKETH